MAEEYGIWLYVITGELDPAVPGAVSGVAGETPRVLQSAELAAVVGDVPLSAFGEEALRRNFEDLDWLGAVAKAHDAVIAAVRAARPVVPIRLATVYHDDERVREMLAQRAADCRRTLDRLTGRTEWGVKLFLGAEPESVAAPSSSSRGGAGTAYLARRRAALSARENRSQRAIEQARRIHARLATLAVDARTHPPQSRALAAENGRMILNAAYLVGDADARKFIDAAEACEEDNDAIRAQVTGPWPPYSFASLEET
ncbi:GvpL/GvpF family gas vesicle protein [Amycolatopsis pithecellobii]|uniref:Gas vesicle protein GvpFL n=1 Tax=Amycolatopsis pithecellobii TaxID=664692 RepID=A0A6N7YNB4_9PSEU|nr:GvpL/GvpF family gas vesicle protein [Amycolatopsis pithecellobii]MTD54465.1 hypothetical protein [Amycolatopsis pithecellobii]